MTSVVQMVWCRRELIKLHAHWSKALLQERKRQQAIRDYETAAYFLTVELPSKHKIKCQVEPRHTLQNLKDAIRKDVKFKEKHIGCDFFVVHKQRPLSEVWRPLKDAAFLKEDPLVHIVITPAGSAAGSATAKAHP